MNYLLIGLSVIAIIAVALIAVAVLSVILAAKLLSEEDIEKWEQDHQNFSKKW